MYELKDLLGKEVKGKYYAAQLKKVTLKKGATFKVERILGERTTPKGEKEYLVRYLGYDSRFDQWLPEKNFVKKKANGTSKAPYRIR